MLKAGTQRLLKSGFYPLVRLAMVLSVLLVGPVFLMHDRQDGPRSDAGIVPAAAASHRTVSPQPAVTEAGPADALIEPVPPTVVKSPPPAIEPARLQGIYRRGAEAIERAVSPEQQAAGARLISVAAALGYPPARAFITREYPRSPAMRAVVPAADAVRYSLDAIAGSADAGASTFMVLVTAYFAGQGELAVYSKYLLDALDDDRHLQSDASINSLLYELSRVAGACVAVSRAVAHVRIIAGSGCSALLKPQLKYYFSHHAPSGAAAESRRQAFKMLAAEADIGNSVAPR
jgi:hypothetical protein